MATNSKDIENLLMGSRSKSMLSEKTQAILNEHIAMELEAAQIYKAMYSWCEYKGYLGAANYFSLHYKEEVEHMDKIYQYMLDRIALPKTPQVKAVSNKFSNFREVIKKALEHEIYVEESYKKSLDKVWSERDHTTFEFLQWYVDEQVDEVAGFSNILDRLDIAGNDASAILMIDKEMGQRDD